MSPSQRSVIDTIRKGFGDRLGTSVLVRTPFVTLEYATASVEQLEWARSYLAPFYSFEAGQSATALAKPTYRVESIVDSDAFAQAVEQVRTMSSIGVGASYQRHRVAEFQARGAERVQLYADRPAVTALNPDERLVLIVADPGDPEQLYEPVRVIREVATKAFESAGYYVLHAGAVVLRDKGIAITGAKRAGKTTSTIALLEHATATFIANDRVYVGPVEGHRLEVHGWPTTARIGVGTCKASAALRRWLDPSAEFEYPQADSTRESRRYYLHEAPDSELWLSRDKVELTPRELLRDVGRGFASSTPFDMLVLPELDPQASTPRVTRPELAVRTERLTRELITPFDDSYPDWLHLRDRPLGRLLADRQRLVDRIATEVDIIGVAYDTAEALAESVITRGFDRPAIAGEGRHATSI